MKKSIIWIVTGAVLLILIGAVFLNLNKKEDNDLDKVRVAEATSLSRTQYIYATYWLIKKGNERKSINLV